MLENMHSMIQRKIRPHRLSDAEIEVLFQDENFKSILIRLEEGYLVYTDLLSYMKDFYDLEQRHAVKLTSFSKKWKRKFQEQSYQTTKAIQLKSLEPSDQLVPKVETRCNALEKVMKTYTNQMNRIYPYRSSKKKPKHYRFDQIRDDYEGAFAPVKRAKENVERLQKQLKQNEKSLHEAKVLLERLQFDPTVSPKKSDHAQTKVIDRQIDCDLTQQNLSQALQDLDDAKDIYRVKALTLFEETQQLEEERLELIRTTVIEFLQTIQSTEMSSEMDSIYDEILVVIQNEHDIQADLKAWADQHGIGEIPVKKTIPKTPAITEMIPFFQ